MRANIELVDATWLEVTFEYNECRFDMKKYFEHKLDDVHIKNNYKHKFQKWDGKIRFYRADGKIYVGFLNRVLKYLTKRKYEIVYGENLKAYILDEVGEYDLSEHSDVPFEMWDFQRETINFCLEEKRVLVRSPTSSGKSYMIHNIISVLKSKGLNSLIVVPSITLVTQMKRDFLSYGADENDIYTISEGKAKKSDHPIIISTWQSLQGLLTKNRKFFHKFDCLVVDEAHGGTAEVIKKITESCKYAFYRFGFSGTYYKTNIDVMTLKGLFGPMYVSITMKEMMDAGYVPKMDVGVIVFNYKEEDRRIIKDNDYNTEMLFIESHIHRNEYVSKIALSRKGNTLCLFRKHAHGKLLYDLTCKMETSDKKIFILNGKNKDEDRQEVINILENNTNCLVYASYGIFSTGVSIKNLVNLILGSDMASFNKVAQSIGRTLRLFADKTQVYVYDIVDNLRITKRKDGKGDLLYPYENYAFRHGFERAELYEIEEFDCDFKSIELEQTYEESYIEEEEE